MRSLRWCRRSSGRIAAIWISHEVAGRIREAVTRQHEIAIETIALIPPATLPKTTSGKIQRSAARKLLLEGALEVLG